MSVSGITVNNAKTTNGSGGGVYIDASGSLSLENVEINGAEAAGSGGGLLIQNSASQPTAVSGLTVNNAKAAVSGGGADISTYGNLSLENVEINRAEASWSGGGLFFSGYSGYSGNSNSNLTISGNSAFTECRSSRFGGALYVSDAETVNIRNTLFRNNFSFENGDNAYISYVGQITFTGCTFEHNSPHPYGSAGPNLLKSSIRLNYLGVQSGTEAGAFINCGFNGLTTNSASRGIIVDSDIPLIIRNTRMNIDLSRFYKIIYAYHGFDLDTVSFSVSGTPQQTRYIEIQNSGYTYRIRSNCSINGNTLTLPQWQALTSSSYGAVLTMYN
jgi:hypothetical protein